VRTLGFGEPERENENSNKSQESCRQNRNRVDGIRYYFQYCSGGAALATPTGFSAIGVALGITSAPLIVTAAPLIETAATVTGVISGGAYFYSRWKSKKVKEESGE